MSVRNNFLRKLCNLIPGYKGYSMRDSSRNIDKNLRLQIVSKLSLTEKKIEQHCLNLVRNNENQVAMECYLWVIYNYVGGKF